MPLVWSTWSSVQRSKPRLTDLSYVAELKWTRRLQFKLLCTKCGSARVSIFASVIWKGFIWALWVPVSLTHPRGPGCPGSRPSVSFPHTLLFSLFRCHLLFRDGGWQTSALPSHFLEILLERALICTNTNPALYCYFELGVIGDIRDREKNTEREEGSSSIASSWINGRKSGTINPAVSLCAVEYRIWWRQSAM